MVPSVHLPMGKKNSTKEKGKNIYLKRPTLRRPRNLNILKIAYYKIKVCKNFNSKNYCPYGLRCEFKHSKYNRLQCFVEISFSNVKSSRNSQSPVSNSLCVI
jgi:hypothetical protein